ALILQTALDYKKLHSSEHVYFVSDDMQLVIEANKLGLTTATSNTVFDLIRSAPTGTDISEEVAIAAGSINRVNRNYLVGGFVLGLAVSGFLFVAWHFRNSLSQTFPLWGLTIAAIISGILLFW